MSDASGIRQPSYATGKTLGPHKIRADLRRNYGHSPNGNTERHAAKIHIRSIHKDPRR